MNQHLLQTVFEKNNIPAFRYFDQVGSTNDIAIEWVSAGAPEYALVMAEAQTSGRGRNGRTWVTTPGASIALSIILHPSPAEQINLGLFSLAAGLAAARAIDILCDDVVQVKWPNDVLINRMKTAGVLAETVWEGNQLKGLVLGFGINLLHESVPPAAELLFPATCLQEHTSSQPEPLALIDALLASLARVRAEMLTEHFLHIYTSWMAYLNEPISLHPANASIINGTLHGIDASGYLVLQMENGELQSFPVGDISLRPL